MRHTRQMCQCRPMNPPMPSDERPTTRPTTHPFHLPVQTNSMHGPHPPTFEVVSTDALLQSMARLMQESLQPTLQDIMEKIQTIGSRSSTSISPHPAVPSLAELQEAMKSTMAECVQSTMLPNRTPLMASRRKGTRGIETNRLHVSGSTIL
jgi:hypothetical protein